MYGKRKISLIFIVFTLFVSVIAGISILFLIEETQKTATIKLIVAPTSADISLNGETYDNLKSHRIKPGTYELVVSKSEYFESWKKSFSINDGETKEFYLELHPLPDTNWYKDHPDDAYPIDVIIDHTLAEKSDSLLKNYPLIKELPIEVEYYKNNSIYIHYLITYMVNDDNTPTILINDYTGGNHDSAIERIRAKGFNPEDYKIEYQDKTSEIAPAFSP